jgi:hypothetical protein
MNSIKEIQRVKFACSRLGGTARVEITYLRFDPTSSRHIAGFDCDNCRDCGVSHSANGSEWVFDWKNCVHPDAPKEH